VEPNCGTTALWLHSLACDGSDYGASGGRMVAKANPNQVDECRKLWKEVHELTLIFSTILNPKKTNKQ